MSPNCIDVERIADVETSPVLRRHVDECPRCQALWLSYRSFMEANVSGATHIDSARRELEAGIRQRAAHDARQSAPRLSLLTRRRAQLSWLRPGMIAAAAAIVALVAISVWRGGSDRPVLRGGNDSTWQLKPPHVSQIAVSFEWSAVPGADAYDVEIFDEALNPVLHSASVATPSITVDRAAFANVATGAELTWRVRALKHGDVIATSPPESMTLK